MNRSAVVLMGLTVGLFGACALLIFACTNDPVGMAATNNPRVPVAVLFKHEDCTVYRFTDSGMSHYYVRCAAGGDVTTMGTYKSGKTTTTEEIPTVHCLKE